MTALDLKEEGYGTRYRKEIESCLPRQVDVVVGNVIEVPHAQLSNALGANSINMTISLHHYTQTMKHHVDLPRG
jgi:hypothetical protein